MKTRKRLIVVRDYPCTFVFPFPSSREMLQYMGHKEDWRTLALREALASLKVNSPCHAYEDYIVVKWERIPQGEEWWVES